LSTACLVKKPASISPRNAQRAQNPSNKPHKKPFHTHTPWVKCHKLRSGFSLRLPSPDSALISAPRPTPLPRTGAGNPSRPSSPTSADSEHLGSGTLSSKPEVASDDGRVQLI
jgi:hypothetical protein